MRLIGLTLERLGGDEVELRLHGAPLARGRWRDGLSGTWVTVRDGALGSTIRFDPPAACRDEANAALMTLTDALFGAEVAGPAPAWLLDAGADAVDWDAIPDDSRTQAVSAFPALLRGALSTEPLVQERALMALHLSITDEGGVFPVAPIAVPLLGRLIEQPGAPIADVVRILSDLGTTIVDLASGLELDLDGPDEDDGLFRPTLGALQALRPSLAALAGTVDPADRAAIEELVASLG
ncbi:MAG: hypothetical protein ABMB14_09660 [Myxococcota bacterium]